MSTPCKITAEPEYPSNSVLRRDAALREVRRRFHDQWQKLLADMAAEEREIDRKFWAGEFSK